MKVLAISGDPSMLIENSSAHARACDYAGLFEELHIIVAAREVSSSPQGVNNLYFYAAHGQSGLARRVRMLRLALKVSRMVRPAVITSQSPDDFGLIGYISAKMSRAPLQLQIHTDIFSPFYRRASWKEWCRVQLARFLIPRANCVRVVSERIKRSIQGELGYPEGKISVLPIFTDLDQFKSAVRDPDLEETLKESTFRMVSVGRLVDKEKNFSLLIEAMPKVLHAIPNAQLVIFGDGADQAQYENMIDNYELRRNVRIQASTSSIASLLKCFDLFLLTSNYEGWARVLLEAMASGLPVVTTDVGLAGEVLKHNENGIVIPVGQKDAIASAIIGLYRDPSHRARLAKAGLITASSLEPLTKGEYLSRYKASIGSCTGEMGSQFCQYRDI